MDNLEQRIAPRFGFPFLLGLASAITVILIVVCSDALSTSVKLSLPVSNCALMACAFVGLAVYAAFATKQNKRAASTPAEGKRRNAALPIAVVALFLVQIIGCFNIHFVTNWDPSVVYGTAWKLAKSLELDGFDWFYFSRYPNNALLLSLEFWAIKVVSYLWAVMWLA
jgi:hypothetical protein